MSKFNHYAKELETMTFETVKKIRTAEEKLNRAKNALNEYPERHGFIDASYQSEHMKRKVAFDEAQKEYNSVRSDAPKEFSNQVSEMRLRLKKEVESYFAVNPSSLQPEVVSFLNSGILNTNDFEKLMNVAVSEGNITMIRLIADRAKKTANEMDNLKDGANKSKLLLIANQVNNYTPETYLTAFDSIVSVSDRCMNNTRLVEHWNTTLGINKAVEAF